jgi:hypothetical protein
VDAPLFSSGKHDLAVNVITKPVRVKLLSEFCVGGKDDLLGFGNGLLASPEANERTGKFHHNAWL